MHKRKIDLADEIFVINVENEIEYAISKNKVVKYLENPLVQLKKELDEIKKDYEIFISEYSEQIPYNKIDNVPFSAMIKMGLIKSSNMKFETLEDYTKFKNLVKTYNEKVKLYNDVFILYGKK